jgi:hypothetical protein
MIGTVELLAGHYGQYKVLLKHYAKPEWSALREYGSRLAVNVPPISVEQPATTAA